MQKSLVTVRLLVTVTSLPLLLLGSNTSLHAETVRSWTGASATSGNWTTAANWSGKALPAAGDVLLFPNTGARRISNTNNFAAGTIFSALTFGDSGYRLRGNSVTLSNSVNAALNSGTNTVDLDIRAGQFALFLRTFASSDALVLNGDVNLNARTLTGRERAAP